MQFNGCCICQSQGEQDDDDFQRRLDQILLDVKRLEGIIMEIQSPKKSTEGEVEQKIKVISTILLFPYVQCL